jgi:DNA topoisomerase III
MGPSKMKILNVAEKPSVARSISSLLSSSTTTRRGLHQYCPNICFSHRSQMVFTSVLGHLYSLDFANKSRWNEVDPEELFVSEVEKFIQPEHLKIKENIEREAVKADMVIIWTDCDREGENIGRQIREVVHGIKRIDVKRARFSGITLGEIENALNNLEDINEADADAVDTRMELDLRIGSAFTRLQTLGVAPGLGGEKKVISFGPCQIPTLGFVVERARQIRDFIEEDFWSLKFKASRGSAHGVDNEFSWSRGDVFDRNCVIHFYSSLAGRDAVISDRRVSEKTKHRPLPLRTVELQKVCASYYSMSAHRVMEVAESLYSKGYISYPRTETDSFDRKFNFGEVLNEVAGDVGLGEHARRLLSGFRHPRIGKNNDMAHSPVYPLKGGNGLSGDDRNIYEFIARRFLACLCEDARALETEYDLVIGNELFSLRGIKILEKNYLEVYQYDKWNDKEVSDFGVGERVSGELCIEDSKTSPPEHLTEAELISLMDKNGIGTDATIHEHIHKIQERGYATKAGNRIKPLELGMKLIDGYDSLGMEVSKPFLRKSLEANLKKICSREVDKDALISAEIEIYRGLYHVLRGEIENFTALLLSGIARDKEAASSTRTSGSTRKRARGEKRSRSSSGPQVQDFGAELQERLSATPAHSPKAPGVLCNCRKPAKLLETKKSSNAGREFYVCSEYPKKCSFFQWVHGEGNRSISLMCHCGYEPQLLVANTETNRGRRFYKCKKAYKPCRFFQWET